MNSGKPQRVQLRRTKGWRMPENTLKVDRTTKWGNQFRPDPDTPGNRAICVALFEENLGLWLRPFIVEESKRELRGKNLACWCALDQPCHADVWLRVANA